MVVAAVMMTVVTMMMTILCYGNKFKVLMSYIPFKCIQKKFQRTTNKTAIRYRWRKETAKAMVVAMVMVTAAHQFTGR